MINLNCRRELFVDEYLIEKRTPGVRFEINHPTRQSAVLDFERSWENPGSIPLTVVNDGSEVRLYYRGFPKNGENDEDVRQTTCVAISHDGGKSFERPRLGHIAYGDDKDNNIVFMGTFSHNFAPFLDANPNATPEDRYKAIGGVHAIGGISVFKSPDGFVWTRIGNDHVIKSERFAFDSTNIAFFDRNIGKYRCYYRWWSQMRDISSCTSEDFVNWSDFRPNVYSVNRGEHFYTNATTQVPGAEHIYISTPMRFCDNRKRLPEHSVEGVSDNVLLTGRDGVYWDRSFTDNWIKPGPDRFWTDRSYMTAAGIVANGGEFSFYTQERYRTPDSQIVRYSIPEYRFGSLGADFNGGEIITKPLLWQDTGEQTGHTLNLNYETTSVGRIQTAVADEWGNIIEGFGFGDSGEHYGNTLCERVMWAGKPLALLANKPIRLIFRLADARIFALR